MRSIALLLFIVSLACAALAQIPAQLFLKDGHFVTPRRAMIIDDVRGSIWDGQMMVRGKAKDVQILVQWQASGFCALALQLCLDVSVRSQSSFGQPSELSAQVSIPIASSLLNSQCLPISGLEVDNVNASISSQFIGLFVPELQTAEQSLQLSNLNLKLDLVNGVLVDGAGDVSLGAGMIEYRVPGQQITRQELPSLSGELRNRSEGMDFQLVDDQQRRFIALNTNQAKDQLRIVIYDAFTQLFGLPSVAPADHNNPRFEISQKISDMLCEN